MFTQLFSAQPGDSVFKRRAYPLDGMVVAVRAVQLNAPHIVLEVVDGVHAFDAPKVAGQFRDAVQYRF